jgi:hypothetical protein
MARLVQSQLVPAMTAFFQKDVRLAEKVTEKDDPVDDLLGFMWPGDRQGPRAGGAVSGPPDALSLSRRDRRG